MIYDYDLWPLLVIQILLLPRLNIADQFLAICYVGLLREPLGEVCDIAHIARHHHCTPEPMRSHVEELRNVVQSAQKRSCPHCNHHVEVAQKCLVIEARESGEKNTFSRKEFVTNDSPVARRLVGSGELHCQFFCDLDKKFPKLP